MRYQRSAENELGREQHRLGFLQAHQFVGVRRGERLLHRAASASTLRERRFEPVGALQDADVIGEHDGLQVAQDAVGFGLGGGIERLKRLVVQRRDLGGIEARRRAARSRSSTALRPAIQPLPTHEPDMKAGEVVGAAGLRQACRQQSRNVGAAIRAGADRPSWSSG